jgi:ornithine cyclodeaminase
MARVYTRAQIEKAVEPREAIGAMERAFRAYSDGRAVIPPVAQMEFQEPPGDCHIKYGYIRGDPTFTVKIATGFWKNPEQGLPSSNGVLLVWSANTGALEAILEDEGYLTDLRTAAAGAVVARHLAPLTIDTIGIIGAGTQARVQLDLLRHVTLCRRVLLWARSPERANAFDVPGFDIQVASSVRDLAAQSQLIVTTTAAREWLLGRDEVRPGTHITAVGADGGGKQELDPRLVQKANIRVVDSLDQCAQYGDSSYALREGLIDTDDLVELGQIIRNPELGRQQADSITIADLTGVAVQDIVIANLVLRHLDQLPTDG